ncbi:MAG: ATP-binding protein [Lachnospiraceae bacterium]|nr:ATP-binding protein [Lachnospiraceae bacterium]
MEKEKDTEGIARIASFILPSDKVDEYERQRQKILDARHLEMYRESGVPEKFWSESFDTFHTESEKEIIAFDTVRDFAREPGNRVLILHGRNGTGKTHMLSAIIRESGGVYITSSMLCMKYDSAIGYKAKMSREDLIEYYTKVKGVLVIDECCKYFLNSDLEKFILTTVVCGRYENNRATALGTNCNKQPFVEFMGKAVFDRLTEVCTTVEFDWDSRRKLRRLRSSE